MKNKNKITEAIRERGLIGVQDIINTECLKWFLIGFGLACVVCLVIVIKTEL